MQLESLLWPPDLQASINTAQTVLHLGQFCAALCSSIHLILFRVTVGWYTHFSCVNSTKPGRHLLGAGNNSVMNHPHTHRCLTMTSPTSKAEQPVASILWKIHTMLPGKHAELGGIGLDCWDWVDLGTHNESFLLCSPGCTVYMEKRTSNWSLYPSRGPH